MGQIISGLLLLAAGTFLVVKSEWFMNNFGRIAWFDLKLGAEGGSRLGYKLVGVAIIILGLILATGSGNAFMEWLLAPLLRYSR